MWTVCATCGAVVADEAVHALWHAQQAPEQP